MANQEHLKILKQGVDVWNKWREQHYDVIPSLDRISGADLSSANLSGANFLNTNFDWSDLSRSNLTKADLRYAGLIRTNLQEANLTEAHLTNATANGVFLEKAILKNAVLRKVNFSRADLCGADLCNADLSEASFYEANLSSTKLTGANLERASLTKTILDGTDLTRANLSNCFVYGASPWNVQLVGATQRDMVITPRNEPTITVDNLEVAQFIYLLLNNKKIRDVLDTITSKVVLILGRFTPEQKAILDAIRDEVHKRNYTPVLFDFDKPSSRDFTETVRTLAHLSRFIIAELTEPSSIPQELQAIIPDLEVPVQPILLEAKREYSMFVDFRKYPWVLPIYLYQDQASLLASLQNEIIEPADKKARELAVEKARRLERP